MIVCPDCMCAKTVEDGERGETYCSKCGRVLAKHEGVASMEMSDTHTPVIKGERSTIMGVPNPGPNRYDNTMNRLRMRDQWVSFRGTHNGLRAVQLRKLRAMHGKLGLPDNILERATSLYAALVKNGYSRGRVLASLMGASLYIACREANVPRTLQVVATVSGVRVKMLSKDMRHIISKGMAAPNQYGLAQLITKIANDLGATTTCNRRAVELAGRLDSMYVAGKNPMSLAAALLYVAGLEESKKHSAAAMAAASGVSTVSIRNRSIEIRELLGG